MSKFKKGGLGRGLGALIPGRAAEDDTPAPKGLDPNGGIKGKRKSKKDKLREAAAKSGGQ